MGPKLPPNIKFFFTQVPGFQLPWSKNGEITSFPGEGAALCGTSMEYIPLSFLRAIPFQISVGFGVR